MKDPIAMRSLRLALLTATLPALFALAGCEDPAKDKPKATVEANASAKTPEKAPEKAAAPEKTLETAEVDAAASSVGFIGSKVTGKHEGKFEKISGKLTLADGKAEGGKVAFEIDTASVKTDEADLDKHLKNADFFDVEKFPKATFTSTEIKTGGQSGASHTVTGELDLHGYKKTISFPVTISITPELITGTAEFSINRRDFGIVIAGRPNDLIRDDVLLKISLKAPRKKG